MAIVAAIGIEREIVTAIEIATDTSTGVMLALIEIATATNGVEENMNVAVCFTARVHMNRQTTVTINIALTPTSRVTETVYSPAQATRGAASLTIRSARIFTSTARADFFRSSAARHRMAWRIATVSCAATKKATKTGRATSSAGAFIDSVLMRGKPALRSIKIAQREHFLRRGAIAGAANASRRV